MLNNIMASSTGLTVVITMIVNDIDTNFQWTTRKIKFKHVVYIERNSDGLAIYEKRNDGTLFKSRFTNYELVTSITSIKLIKEVHNEDN